MDDKITIKQIKDFQLAGLFNLVRKIYLSSKFMSDDFDRKFPGIDHFDEYYKNTLRQPGSFVLSAFNNQDAVGYLSIEANPAARLRHTAHLNMGVDEDYRGKGVGRQLLRAAIEKAKSVAIIEIIYLMVRADHFGAINLYGSSGFIEVARLEKDTKIANAYFDGILMRKFV